MTAAPLCPGIGAMQHCMDAAAGEKGLQARNQG